MSGAVTVEGHPLTGGVVVFENAKAGVLRGVPLDPNGRFEDDAIPALGYCVYILPAAPELPGPAVTSDLLPAPPPNASAIPERFQSPATSHLTATVHPRKVNTFQYDLTRAPAGNR